MVDVLNTTAKAAIAAKCDEAKGVTSDESMINQVHITVLDAEQDINEAVVRITVTNGEVTVKFRFGSGVT